MRVLTHVTAGMSMFEAAMWLFVAVFLSAVVVFIVKGRSD